MVTDFNEINLETAKPKYTGRGGYHGGGRPREGEEIRRITLSIVGTASEIEQIKALAKASGKSTSRFAVDKLLEKQNDEKQHNKRRT